MITIKQATFYTFILSLISPFLGLVLGLKTLNRRGKQQLLTIFGLFYGLLLTYPEGSDASTHAENLKRYYNLGLSDFFDWTVKILNLHPHNNSASDLYLHLLSGIAGSLLSSPQLLFALVGTVYGYFYGAALLKVIHISKGSMTKLGSLTFMLIFLFVIHRSFDNMQTIRSWTGMWVLFNGVFGYSQTREYKYLFLILASPLFHLMYGFIAIPALIAIIFNFIHKYFFIGIYFLSFFLSIDTVSFIDKVSEAGNDFTERRIGYYYKLDDTGKSIDPIAERREKSDAVLYAKYGKTTSVYVGATAFMIFLILGGYYSKLIMNNIEYTLMTTAIMMASLANFLSFAYAFYSRTMGNATTYVLAVMVLLALRGVLNNNFNSSLKRMGAYIGIIIFIPKVLFFLSSFMYLTSALLFTAPFLRFLGADANVSIRDVINLLIAQ